MANTLANSDGWPQFRWADPPRWPKKPNAFGLHDMRTFEWCLDAVKRQDQLLGDRKTGTIDPFSQEGEWRALRGGNFEVPHSSAAPRTGERMLRPQPIQTEDSVGPRPRFGSRRKLHRDKRGQGKKIENLSLVLKPIPEGSFQWEAQARSPRLKPLPTHSGTSSPGRDGKLASTDFSGRPLETLHEFNSSITALASAESSPLLVGCQNGETHLFDLKKTKFSGRSGITGFPLPRSPLIQTCPASPVPAWMAKSIAT